MIECESYRKYLLHKNLNKHRIKGLKRKESEPLDERIRGCVEVEAENDRIRSIERMQHIEHLPALSLTHVLEETKQSCSECEEEAKEDVDYKELYEKEQKEWMDQRTEIKQELERIKNQYEDKSNEPQSISYDEGLIIKYLYAFN